MKKIWYLPIEPYPNRYTQDWIKEFEEAFERNGYEYETILGEQLIATIQTGNVLDAEGTNYWKMTQMASLIKAFSENRVKDGDVIFNADLWYPSLEVIPYICSMKGINVSIQGVFHAGTYDEHDFTYRNGMTPWGKYSEKSWLTMTDKIYLGSRFHKELILSKRNIEGLEDKLIVTGLPVNVEKIRAKAIFPWEKKKRVMFSHRLDPEKRFDLFCETAIKVSKEVENVEFMVSSPRKIESKVKREILKVNRQLENNCIMVFMEEPTRHEYFKAVAQSVIIYSCAEQETFGYSVMEGIVLHAVPVVPRKLSYRTMYSSNFTFYTLDEGKDKCVEILKAFERGKLVDYYAELDLLADYYNRSIDRIVKNL